jgi:hypothetical protein
MKNLIRTLPCTTDDITMALEALWPRVALAYSVNTNVYGPIIDGHMGIGFSIKLFGTPPYNSIASATAYEALEVVLRGLEDRGFFVSREGNEWQEGRLVLGWYSSDGYRGAKRVRLCDLPISHPESVVRRKKLWLERNDRDKGTAR